LQIVPACARMTTLFTIDYQLSIIKQELRKTRYAPARVRDAQNN
jgi:hypothetical protein